MAAEGKWSVPTEDIMKNWSPSTSAHRMETLGEPSAGPHPAAMAGPGAGREAEGVAPLDGPEPGSDAQARAPAQPTTIEQSSQELSTASFFTLKRNELRLCSVLGSGAQATVYKAEWTRQLGAAQSWLVVAVKRLHDGSDSATAELCRDREALAAVTEHSNLVRCFDATVDAPFLVVTEYCGGGSLFDILYNSDTVISMKQSTKILLDVASGMRYLHEQQPCILHRDLKSSNILLMRGIRDVEQVPFAKVGDFALARTAPSAHATPTSTWSNMTTGVGTWRWMAPEVFEMDDSGMYDWRCDVFSFAMLMYETVLRKMPYIDQFPEFDADPRLGIHIALGLRPSLEEDAMPKAMATEIQQAWSAEPDVRPTFARLEESLRAQYIALGGTIY